MARCARSATGPPRCAGTCTVVTGTSPRRSKATVHDVARAVIHARSATAATSPTIVASSGGSSAGLLVISRMASGAQPEAKTRSGASSSATWPSTGESPVSSRPKPPIESECAGTQSSNSA